MSVCVGRRRSTSGGVLTGLRGAATLHRLRPCLTRSPGAPGTYTLAVSALAALALVGCGDGADTRTSPAAAVPAEAALYAEAVLRPQGDQRESLERALGLLLDVEDPAAAIIRELDEQTAQGGSQITYAADIEPWLGERGAVFFTELIGGGDEAPPAGCAEGETAAGGADPAGCALPGDSESGLGGGAEHGALLIESEDDAAATRFAEKAMSEDGEAEDAEYEGAEYLLDEDEFAVGVVAGYLVAGDETSLKQVVDTAAGGAALVDDEEFGSYGAGAGDAAASLYVDLPALLDQAIESDHLSDSDRAALSGVGGNLVDEPLSARIEAEPEGVGLELSYGSTGLPLLSAARQSDLLGELPGDSWLGFGFSGLGDGVQSLIEGADALGLAGADLEAARRGFRSEYGVRLEDFYEPLGDGALFASGEGLFGTGGGVVVEADSAAGARRVLGALRRAAVAAGDQVRPLRSGEIEGFALTIPDAPAALNFVVTGRRLVAAYGEQATLSAIEPDQTLAESEVFESAATRLGEELEVTGFIDFNPLVELLGLAAAVDPSLQEAMPYVRSLSFAILGGRSVGGRDELRLFVGLQDALGGPAL